MISIVNSMQQPQYLDELRAHFDAEWAKVDPIEGNSSEFIMPAPLLVLDGDKLIGGLAFTSAPKPGGDEPGLWVNAVLVLPQYRGQGLASKLIKQAKAEAMEIDAGELFAYTDIPALYSKLGWLLVDDSGESSVLKIVL